jgi:hypothetical protein
MMMKMQYTVKICTASLLLCGAAWANPDADSSKAWKARREKNLKLGFTAERVDRALGECRKKGMTAGETDALLCPVYAASAESLPTECVFIKTEEGLAKQVDTALVAAAAEARLDCLRQADRMVSAVRQGRGGEHQHLVMHSCVALESGLPAEVLQNIFNRPGGFRYGRLIHVVEAGETLQLGGLDPKDIQQIMNDCLDRDLNYGEVMRAVDFIIAEHRSGKDFKTIHSSLWVRSD